MGASEEHFLLGSFRVFLPVVMTPCGVRLCEVCGSIYLALYVDRPSSCLHVARGFKYFLWKPKKGNFSYFGIWFLGVENRVFVRGSLFGAVSSGVVYIPVYIRFCFGCIVVFLLGCFGWFTARFILRL